MSLLTTIQRAAVLSGMPRPAAISGESAIAQMVECARIDAEEMAAKIDWSTLVRHHTFTTTNTVAQTTGLPTDYLRMTFRGGLRQANRLWALEGPTANADWDRLVQFPTLPSRWRVFGGAMQILPAPSAAQTISYDYVTHNLYRSDAGVAKATWDLGTDVCLIPETLIALGTVWRWRQMKGLEYGEAMATAQAEMMRAAGNDGAGRGAITTSRGRWPGGTDSVFAFPGVLGP